ncbi:conserved hypothetical protein [Desulfovibrionales bacterium]
MFGRLQSFFTRSRSPVLSDFEHFTRRLKKGLLAYDHSMSEAEKICLFLSMIELVEFEPHGFCNRRCSFCPNATAPIRRDKTPLDRALYCRLLAELAAMGYRGGVRFARYCEPLAFSGIVDYVVEARAALPESEIDIVSNADYLDRPLLDQLVVAGLSVLRLSIYPDGHGEWTHDAVDAVVGRIAERLDFTPTVIHESATSRHWEFSHQGPRIFAVAQNLACIGLDRGQSLPELIDPDYLRLSPCLFVFQNLTIDYTGALMSCCNFIGEIEAHHSAILARLETPTSLLDAYFSLSSVAWRRALVGVGPKSGLCASCKQKIITDPADLVRLGRIIDEQLQSMRL